MRANGQEFTSAMGDLALKVGLSRPAGQCFGAIWRSAQAYSADDLAASLGLSRSNVSTALKELRGWGLIAVERATGDRRDYFAAPGDPWEVLRIILAGRVNRDLVPMIDRLRQVGASDGRAAVLSDVMTAISDRIGAVARLLPDMLAQEVVGAPSAPDKKRKKKKKAGA